MNIIEVRGEKVRESLCYLEDAYTPVLSQRIPDFDEYASKLSLYADNYVIYSDGGDLVGYIAFYANDMTTKTAYISQLVVNPRAQRSGIGKRLVEICFSIATNRGMEAVRLEVRNDNVNAIKFYEKVGFSQESINEKSRYMVCDITNFNSVMDMKGMDNEE